MDTVTAVRPIVTILLGPAAAKSAGDKVLRHSCLSVEPSPKRLRVSDSVVLAVVIVVEIDGFRIAQRAQSVARLGGGEAVAAIVI